MSLSSAPEEQTEAEAREEPIEDSDTQSVQNAVDSAVLTIPPTAFEDPLREGEVTPQIPEDGNEVIARLDDPGDTLPTIQEGEIVDPETVARLVHEETGAWILAPEISEPASGAVSDDVYVASIDSAVQSTDAVAASDVAA